MNRNSLASLAALLLACQAAKGPVISIDRDAVARVRRLAIVPVLNLTDYDKLDPMLEQVFVSELVNLDYDFIEPKVVRHALDSLGMSADDLGNPFNVKTLGEAVGADGVVGLLLTTYVPFSTEVLPSERKQVKKEWRTGASGGRPPAGTPDGPDTVRTHGVPVNLPAIAGKDGLPDSQQTRVREPAAETASVRTSGLGTAEQHDEQAATAGRRSRGPGGLLLSLLVPDDVSVTRTKYDYATVARKPSLGATIYLIETGRGRLIYNASKFIDENARIPGAYSKTYGNILDAEDMSRVDFVARLAAKEMLDPLRRRS
jgi:hypothetical protein